VVAYRSFFGNGPGERPSASDAAIGLPSQNSL
jgi:hypothetical protein